MLHKISSMTLAEQVAQALMDYIVSQNLKPGEVLPSEARLVDDLGVSRAIIREALKSLAGRGVVEIMNGKGAVVKPVDGQPLSFYFQRAVLYHPRSLIELMEVRKGLEVQSAALAAERRTTSELLAMSETVAAMESALHTPEVFADLDVTFHLQIAKASRNNMLYYLIESIRESLRGAILEGLRRSISVSEEQLQTAWTIHQSLLEPLEKGDVAGAKHYMTVHFDKAIVTLRDDALAERIGDATRRNHQLTTNQKPRLD